MTVREKGQPVEKIPDTRGQIILSALINEHFVTGEPVGSKALADKFANAHGLSSATIRNVMSELEDAGYVEQPHTSAGRVPTDKGYRFYVDNLLGVLSISNDDLVRIGEGLGLNANEVVETSDRLMERTSQLLSALSNNVGIVVSPSLADDRLQHIEFVNLSDNRILVVHQFHYLRTDLDKTLSDKLGIQIISCLLEFLSLELDVQTDDLVMHKIWRRDKHDENAVVGKIDKLNMLQAIIGQAWRNHDAYVI